MEISDWEQECCGKRISLNQVVTWEVFLRPRPFGKETDAWGTGLTELIETHHDMFIGGTQVTGRVTRIRAVWPEQGILAGAETVSDIEQIWGPGDSEDGCDYGREINPEFFVVTLRVPSSAKLPTSPAERKTDA